MWDSGSPEIAGHLVSHVSTFSLARQFGQMKPRSFGIETDPRQAEHDTAPNLFAKLVEYGTANQTTVFADTLPARESHTY